MSWTRAPLAALAVCVLLLTGSAGCASRAAHEPGGGESAASPSPVGKVLEDTDGDGRHYREVEKKGAPEVGVEVQPDADGSWDVRLKVSRFRFSPSGAATKAVPGRGAARLYVDEQPVADLRGPAYRIPAGYLPHGTHHVTARLYADDGTVWAVDGKPIESTADITASEPEAHTDSTADSKTGSETAGSSASPSATASPAALSAPGTFLRTQGRGSPDAGGKAS